MAIVKTSISCDCADTCGVVTIIDFDEYGEDSREVYADFSLGYYGTSLRSRLRAALRVVRGQDPWLHSLCFHAESVEKLRAALAGREGD